MHKRSYYIVNSITLYRLLAAPMLVLLIINYRLDWFKWLLALSFFTDAIDGYLARKYKVASIMGAKLDSIADDLTVVAGIAGMVVLKPEFFKHALPFMILLLALFIIQTTLALTRYGKVTSFHTYAAKISAILQGSFLILLFFLDDPLYWLFYATVIVTGIDLLEEIILVLMLPQWQANVKGIWAIKRGRKR